MPVFQLSEDLEFPHPSLANSDGILAVGGDLSVERLLLAYCNGIFPWYSEEYPILWWSPDPRFVLFPKDVRISRSMKKLIRKGIFKVTFDTCFQTVMTKCGSLRSDDTWINAEMIASYSKLHRLGFAHSVETWYDGQLVGGLYGLSIGKFFFGESMFSTMDNASKYALITLSEKLIQRNFLMIDCQVYSTHLESMGAVNIPREDFLNSLKTGLEFETLRGSWSDKMNQDS